MGYLLRYVSVIKDVDSHQKVRKLLGNLDKSHTLTFSTTTWMVGRIRKIIVNYHTTSASSPHQSPSVRKRSALPPRRWKYSATPASWRALSIPRRRCGTITALELNHRRWHSWGVDLNPNRWKPHECVNLKRDIQLQVGLPHEFSRALFSCTFYPLGGLLL